MANFSSDSSLKLASRFASRSQLLLLCIASTLWGCPQKEEKIALPQSQPIASAADTNVTDNKSESVANVNNNSDKDNNSADTDSTNTSAPAGAEGSNAGRAQSTRVSGQVKVSKQGQASFKVPGHLVRTFVQVGDRVRKGQVLAQLDNTDFELRVRAAANQVELSQVSLEQAKRDLDRESQLRKEGATTATNFERVSNQLASAQISLSSAQIASQQAQKAVSDTKLMASFDGVVSREFKVEGEYVAIGAAVFEVSSLTDLEVSLKVPEFLLSSVKVGNELRVSIPSASKETVVTISRLVPVIQENSRTFEVIGKFKGSENVSGVVPGQFVEGSFDN